MNANDAGQRGSAMKNTATAARIVLGLVFLAAGVSGFFIINNPPPMPPGLAATFMNVFFQSRWALYINGVEIVAGILLLVKRYVPLALLATAAIIFNMSVFHLTMMLIGLPGPLLLLGLWIIVATQHRKVLEPLLAPKA
jgi:putative oxidoreductase